MKRLLLQPWLARPGLGAVVCSYSGRGSAIAARRLLASPSGAAYTCAVEHQIGDFSRMARLSIKTLRFYHEQGLLQPVRIDPDTGYRYYSDRSLERAQTITRLKELEFSLKEISELLGRCEDDEEIIAHLERKSREVAERIHDYRRVQRELRRIVQAEREAKRGEGEERAGEGPNNVVVRSLPPILVASARFKVQLLPGCRVLCLLHRGPYSDLGRSYGRLFEALNLRGGVIGGPIRECYLKGPGFIFRGNPKGYLTEIHAPLSPQPHISQSSDDIAGD